MDSMMLGLSTTAVGMLVVFSGLVILIACIYGMTCLTGRKAKEPAPAKVEEAPAAAPVAVEEAPAPAAEVNDEQLIAVISAAIAAVWEGQGSSFVVRRVRRAQTASARARAARDEQIYSRL